MSFRNSIDLRRVTCGCLLLAGNLAWAAAEERADPCGKWRDVGTLLLCRLGPGQRAAVAWLDRRWAFLDPGSGQAVATAEALLKEAFKGYAHDHIAVAGRVPLDVNPQCLLGLYLARRFPDVRLGDWGQKRFEGCIEQSCMTAMPQAGAAWRTELEAALLGAAGGAQESSCVGAFALSEAPYLYLYLIHHARSQEDRNRARERLARCLWQGYGLEPGLEQYWVLFEQGYGTGRTWLDVAAELERLGASLRAKRLYGWVLKNAASAAEAETAFEGLARILLPKSREGEIRMAWESLSRRFPDAECAVSEIKALLSESPAQRAERGRQFLAELAGTTNPLHAQQLCRLFHCWWTPMEAVSQWQTVLDRAEPGTLGEQLGRVFLARALLETGKADMAETLVKGLAESATPCVQAQSAAVLGGIARTRGDAVESARLYSRAAQIDTPTVLPSWHRELIRSQPLDEEASPQELQAQSLFFAGCHSLIAGDYDAALDDLGEVAAAPCALPDPLRRALPGVMMLACLGAEDYRDAEAWGRKALEESYRDQPYDAGMRDSLARSQSLDIAVSQLVTRTRTAPLVASASPTLLRDAGDLCRSVAALDLAGAPAAGPADGMRQLYARATRLHVARVLAAEHQFVRQGQIGAELQTSLPGVEPLLFAAQLLRDDSFEQVARKLARASEAKGLPTMMYRFAVFAQDAGRQDLARGALDVAASGQSSVADSELWENIARMYLTAASYQKAIGIYEKIAANTEDADTSRSVLRKIIDIYADDLKDYGKAIQQCEAFIKRYPDDSHISDVEFLLGKYAYLRRDYAGAVGQLDGFRTKWPHDPLAGQAMLLAGLSRMAEGNNQEAVGRFNEIIRRYPDGELAARSRFLTGYAQVSAQKYSAALETFKQLIEQFPQSQYVPQAQSLIDRLEKISR